MANQPDPSGYLPKEGIKHDQGRIHRFDLIPTFPLYKLAEVYGIGAKKYSDNNWRGGFRWGRIFRAMIGHALAWWAGVKVDPHDGQHPLASVAWCAFTLMEFERKGLGQDDRVEQLPLANGYMSQIEKVMKDSTRCMVMAGANTRCVREHLHRGEHCFVPDHTHSQEYLGEK